MFGEEFFSRFAGGGGSSGGFETDAGSGEVDNQQLYNVLEINQNATQDEIKASYRKLVKLHHPDKGGQADKFKEINAANEVLSDPEKRKIYDKYGLEGLRNGGGGSGMSDIFDIFFGGGGRKRGGQQETPKLKPIVKKIEVTLDDIYHGKMVNLNVTRDKVCIDCNGKGGSKVDKCTKCKGKGVVVKMVQLGPGMYSQSQGKCDNCQGLGEIISKDAICKPCKGKKTLTKTEEVEVPIPIGAPQNHQILIPDKGDEHPVYRTGDLVVVLTIKTHPVFKRFKNDLLMTKKISLIESLSGFKFNLKRFDTEVTISSPPNNIVKHKDIKVIKNLGIHPFKNELSNGDLMIEFIVDMPSKLTLQQIEGLKTLLPKPILQTVNPTKNTYQFIDGPDIHPSINEKNNVPDEDEEESEEPSQRGFKSGEKVECQQQ